VTQSCAGGLGDSTESLLGLEFIAEYDSSVMQADSEKHQFSISMQQLDRVVTVSKIG
jgi:hypothetical protein